MIVAHRGASKKAPENTMPAFELAWKQGADAIEADFRLTKDSHIVCIHDENTKRVSGKNLVVAESTLAQLRELDAGSQHGKKFKGTVIPTISEVFDTIPENKAVYIEIKTGPEIVPSLVNEIKNSGLNEEQVMVISFNKEALREMKTEAPQYRTSLLCSFQKKNDNKTPVTPPLKFVLETLEFARADAISANTVIPLSYLDAIRKEGYEWHAWTVDDVKMARHMKELGAKSITTNVPDKLKENLFEKDSSDEDTPAKSGK